MDGEEQAKHTEDRQDGPEGLAAACADRDSSGGKRGREGHMGSPDVLRALHRFTVGALAPKRG